MLRVLPFIVSILYLGFVALWFVGGLVEIPLPLIDAPVPETSGTTVLSRLETRLEDAPNLAFIASAIVCAALLLILPRMSPSERRDSTGSATASTQATAVGSAGVDNAPLLPNSRLSIPEKIERLKELRRETRDGDTASMKAMRLHQRILERAGRFEHD